jgi:hypothetical protein
MDGNPDRFDCSAGSRQTLMTGRGRRRRALENNGRAVWLMESFADAASRYFLPGEPPQTANPADGQAAMFLHNSLI